MMNWKNNSDSQFLGLVLKQIENVTQEIQRTVSLMAQALKISGDNTKEIKELTSKVINILTNDKDGFRKLLLDVNSKLETYNTLEIEKKKSLWSLRNVIIGIVVTNLITFIITKFV